MKPTVTFCWFHHLSRNYFVAMSKVNTVSTFFGFNNNKLKGENWNRSRGFRKSWKFIKLYSQISQRVFAQITRSTRRWKAYDPYFWKNKNFCIRPQFPLICAMFEDKWNFWALQIRTSSNIPLKSWKWGRMYLKILFL